MLVDESRKILASKKNHEKKTSNLNNLRLVKQKQNIWDNFSKHTKKNWLYKLAKHT